MIDIRELTYRYPKNSSDTIKKMEFSIERGEIFGFLGPSGAGKTTTRKLITGLLKGYGGSILVDGRERKNWDNTFFEKIGVVFEIPNLYLKLTGYENLKLFSGYYKKKTADVTKALERTGILDAMDRKVSDFSKGMKVRLNFIRAALHDPDIMFLDEPVSGLDPANGAIIKEMICEMRDRGKTIFLTTHNMTVASELCDRVSFITNGQLSLTDNPANLMRRFGKNELSVEYTENGKVMERIFSIEGLYENTKFQQILKAENIRSMKTLDATLEEIFIKVTGKGL